MATIDSPMAGKVLEINVAVGDTIAEDDEIMVLEAMKMENPVFADVGGVVKEIKVKAGQTVNLTLKHVGQMDKKVMGHNFVLLKKGTDLSAFGEAAVAAGPANEYIPNGGADVIAHTKLIGGGESDTISFKAPEAGTYDFICSFPGHLALMKGTFIVE